MQATKTQIENYPIIYFCSNKLIEVNNIINDNGIFPIEIKKDQNHKPLISLTINHKGEPITVVKNNKILYSSFSVNKYLNDSKIEVLFSNVEGKYIIMELIIEGDIPHINKFDLKPLGYNIYGDENGLNIGEMTLANNSFQSNTFINI